MNAVERVKTICKERKIPISKLESDCGFGNGYIGQLRKGTFPSDRLLIISEYLSVSFDFLSKGIEPEYTFEMSQQDLELSNMDNRMKEYALKMNKLSHSEQELIMQMIDKLSEK